MISNLNRLVFLWYYRFKFKKLGLLFVLALSILFVILIQSKVNVLSKLDVAAKTSDKVDHYTIALIVRSLVESGDKLSPGVQAIIDFAEERVAQINRPHGKEAGGINGIRVRLKILNDEADENKAVSLVNQTLKDPNLIAIYGLVSPTKGAVVIKAIGRHKVPFISEIPDDNLFSQYPYVFTMKTSASDDIRAYTHFISDNYTSTIFIGGVNDHNTKRYHDALGPVENKVKLLSVHRLPARNVPQYAKAIKAAIAEIKDKKPGIISLSAGLSRNADILKQLASTGLDIPVFFINGEIEYAKKSLRGNIYFGDLFELDPAIPNVVSGRLAMLRRQPGFNRLNALNDYAAQRTLAYLDILSWLKEAAQSANASLSPAEMRNHIGSQLLGYRPGRRIFNGLSTDWSFTDRRSRAQLSLIKWWNKGADRPVIWKIQYKPDGKRVTQIPVAFLSIDMVRIVGVNSNRKSFNAEFYVSVASHQNIGLDRFEFGNALLSENDGKPLVHHRLIDGNLPAVHSRGKRRLYKVSGSFQFNPDLSRYPFDQQPFTISLQARDSTLPVFIQPPPLNLRDKNISIAGWTMLEGSHNNYVGFDTSTVTLSDQYMSSQEVVQFYEYSFTWIAERLSLNYYLRVIIPLGLIVIVAYASVFMPNSHIASVVSIKVTALLSTIALYFSIPKFDTETATLSDRIFVFTESMIVLMIVSSIIRVIVSTDRPKIYSESVKIFQAISVPIFCYLMMRYVLIVRENTGAIFAGQSITDIFFLLVGIG